jgi:RNA polymerase sigma-70 factor, ECF subfamily
VPWRRSHARHPVAADEFPRRQASYPCADILSGPRRSMRGVTVHPDTLAPEDLESHRRELTAYCYRMLGSGFDAEDAVQETMVRAWRAGERFEGRSSIRSWLYRIATNVCLDMLRGRQRRARPMELGPSRPPVESSLDAMLPEGSWVSPIADERVLPPEADPAEVALARDSIRLAFVAALQHLPARQRAALILCEVLRWQAAEAAELLDTSVAAINSALQRARATLASVGADVRPAEVAAGQRDLLARFVDAFERYDIDNLVKLLHEDAVQSMPPFAMWLRGAGDIGRFMLGPGAGCRGSRLIAVAANGCPAFGQYKPDPAGGYAPWALQVLEISGDRIAGINSFLDTESLFPAFGLPGHLPA